MEVTIKVESLGDPSAMHRDTIDDSGKLLTKVDNGGKNVEWTPLCLGRFTMVAKDFEGKTVQVNPLLLHNDHEKELFQLGAKRKEQKLEAAKQNDLRKQQPNSVERDFLQGIYQELHQYEDGKGAFQKDRLPAGVVMMSDTILDNVKLCHPQERNIHSSIFGGFLMKEAFEIAYTNAMLFTKGRPYTVALDEIAFKKPVPIGSVLLLTSQVVYAEGPPHRTFQVEVTAEIIPDVRNDNEKVVTNVFNYTFASGKENDSSVPRVLPYSYGEFMQTLKAKRRRDIGIQMKKAQLEEFKKYKIIPE
jgi:acyl-coenzyme A thioesterase 9